MVPSAGLVTICRRMDPPFAHGLDNAPNEKERVLPMEIIEQSEMRLSEVLEMVERKQTQNANASTEAKSCSENQATAPKINAAIGDILGVDTPTSDIVAGSTIQRSLLCPIHRLPPEVLRAIFQHCQDKEMYLINMLTAFDLSLVCRYWRAVACSFGALWRYICLQEDLSWPGYVQRIKLFLGRSCPGLEVVLDEGLSNRLYNRLIPLDRVHRLHVQLSDVLDDARPFNSWSVVLAHLSHLKINTTAQDCVRTICGDFLSIFPNLEDLELINVNLEFSNDFQLTNLRRIYWDFYPNTTLSVVGDVYSHAPHLESFFSVCHHVRSLSRLLVRGQSSVPLRPISMVSQLWSIWSTHWSSPPSSTLLFGGSRYNIPTSRNNWLMSFSVAHRWYPSLVLVSSYFGTR
jgi:hypothetical protein